METSSDPHINIAFNDIEFKVNTANRGTDKGTVQRQTCLSSDALGRSAEKNSQHYVHRNSLPTEIGNSTSTKICLKQRGRGQPAPEGTAGRLSSRDRETNVDSSSIDDSGSNEESVQSPTIVIMKDIHHKLQDEDDTNYLKDKFVEEIPKLHEQDVVEEPKDQGADGFTRLLYPDILLKLRDNEVVKECDILDTLKDMHLSNVEVMEQVGRSEPAVKRLLGRHQLVAKDVKDISVDEDIKSQVETFLRTNVTGNLLVTRVLRENYSVFQSWLTAHLQVERNAGVARYKQVLQMLDTQRRQQQEMAAILTDVAQRIQRLLQACNAALSDKPKKGFQESYRQVPTNADMCRISTCGTGSMKQQSETAKTPHIDNEYCCPTHNQGLNKISCPLGRCSHSSNSSCDIQKSTYNGGLSSTADSDTVSVHDRFSRQGKHWRTLIEANHCHMCGPLQGSSLQEKDAGYMWHKHSQTGREGMACARNHSMSNSVCHLSAGERTGDIYDSLNRLSVLCERLISDQISCLRLMGVDPNNSVSLTEAVWLSLHHRCQDCCRNKPGMERRLEALEQENRNLLNELNVLQSRLVDKNAELLSLQNRLERCETLLKESAQSTGNQCETRDICRLNNSDRRANKSSYYINKMCGEVLASSPNTSLTPNTGLYPMLQCSKITSNERIVANGKTSTRINQRGTASEEGGHSSENSIRGLTDKLHKLRMNQAGLDNISTDMVETVTTQSTEKAGSVVDTGKHTQPDRSGTSRINNKTVGERKSWRHSLYVVQSSVTLRDGADHGSADVMSANVLELAAQSQNLAVPPVTDGQSDRLVVQKTPTTDGQSDRLAVQKTPVTVGQSDRLAVQKTPTTDGQNTPATDGQTENLAVQNTPAIDGQPAVTWTLSPQIASRDSPIKTKDGSATMPAISKSHTNQHRHTNSRTDSGSKQKVPCRLNRADRSDEEKDSSKLKTKCVLQASVVSLVSSLINDSTSMLPRTGQPGKAAVSKCLRCQKLFNWTDNHKLACSYHTEPLASAEKFNQAGKIVQVFNQWRCCLQAENSQGCCFGQHI